MQSKLLSLSLAIALLTCILTLTMAVRSYFWWKLEGLTFNSSIASSGRQNHYCVSVKPFGLTLSHHRLSSGLLDPGWRPFSSNCAPLTVAQCDRWYRGLGGFGVGGIGLLPGVARRDTLGRIYEVSLPHWMLIPLSTVIPVLLARRLRLARNHGLNVCSVCGYDLRATPDRCPECGRATTAVRPAD